MGPLVAASTSLLAPRALAVLPSLAVRRAVIRERIATSPVAAARGLDALIRAAVSGGSGGRDGALALASTVAHLRREGASASVARVRDAAAREGISLVAALLEDAPPHRAIARLGRAREICFPERAPLRFWPARWERDLTISSLLRLLTSPRFLELLHHPSPVLIARLLRHRWIALHRVLEIASRRPTSEAVALELVCHDGWLQRPEVRDAMVMNPFTATPLVLALLPSVSAVKWRHLAVAGDAHPLVASAADMLLAVRGG